MHKRVTTALLTYGLFFLIECLLCSRQDMALSDGRLDFRLPRAIKSPSFPREVM